MQKSKTLLGFKIVADGGTNLLTLEDAYCILQLKVMVASDTDLFGLVLSMAQVARTMNLKSNDVYWTAGDRVIAELELIAKRLRR